MKYRFPMLVIIVGLATLQAHSDGINFNIVLPSQITSIETACGIRYIILDEPLQLSDRLVNIAVRYVDKTTNLVNRVLIYQEIDNDIQVLLAMYGYAIITQMTSILQYQNGHQV